MGMPIEKPIYLCAACGGVGVACFVLLLFKRKSIPKSSNEFMLKFVLWVLCAGGSALPYATLNTSPAGTVGVPARPLQHSRLRWGNAR
jgi:hypothetical protein